MNPFQQRAASRIALVTFVLAAIASPASWFVAREYAEDSIVSLASEESQRILAMHDATNLTGLDALGIRTARVERSVFVVFPRS